VVRARAGELPEVISRGWKSDDRGAAAVPSYINTTSTRECTGRPGFACESVRMLMYVGVNIEPKQRLVA
jgi:hypothetical protein